MKTTLDLRDPWRKRKSSYCFYHCSALFCIDAPSMARVSSRCDIPNFNFLVNAKAAERNSAVPIHCFRDASAEEPTMCSEEADACLAHTHVEPIATNISQPPMRGMPVLSSMAEVRKENECACVYAYVALINR